MWEVLTNKLNEPEMQIINNIGLDSLSAVVGVSNPSAGAFCATVVSAIKELSANVDEIKLKYLIIGLAKGLNTEMLTNELVTFIYKDNNKANLVVDTFRKALLNDSKIATVIMGFVLADCINNKYSNNQKQSIIYKAIDNVTDMDLINFLNIMKTCVNRKNNEVHLERLQLDEEMESNYILTCDWCVYNRIFSSLAGTIFDLEDETHEENDNYGSAYSITPIADMLYEYINRIPRYILEEYIIL